MSAQCTMGRWKDVDTFGAIILSPVEIGKIVPAQPNHTQHYKNLETLGKYFTLRKVSFLLPIASNPPFAPSNMDGFFNGWKVLGIGNIGDLYIEGTFASFEQLRIKDIICRGVITSGIFKLGTI